MQRIPDLFADAAKAHLDADEAVFIDVRQPDVFAEGHIPGAYSLSDEVIQAFVEKFNKKAKLIIYCYAGNFAPGASKYLQQKGFRDVWVLRDGFHGWETAYPEAIETGEPVPIPGI